MSKTRQDLLDKIFKALLENVSCLMAICLLLPEEKNHYFLLFLRVKYLLQPESGIISH